MTNDQHEFWVMAATESYRRWMSDDEDRENDFEHGAEWCAQWTLAFVAMGEWCRGRSCCCGAPWTYCPVPGHDFDERDE